MNDVQARWQAATARRPKPVPPVETPTLDALERVATGLRELTAGLASLGIGDDLRLSQIREMLAFCSK